MSAAILDGRVIAAAIESELRTRVAQLVSAPRLAVVQVGDDPASTSYIRAKSRAAERVGIKLAHHHLSAGTSLEKLVRPTPLHARWHYGAAETQRPFACWEARCHCWPQ